MGEEDGIDRQEDPSSGPLPVCPPAATQLLLLEQVHRKGSCFQSHAHHRNQQLHAQSLRHMGLGSIMGTLALLSLLFSSLVCFHFSFLFPSMHGNVLFENIYWELDHMGLGEVEEHGREWRESWFGLRPCE